MFALHGSLLAYIERCNRLVVIDANKPNKYGAILTNFALPQMGQLTERPTNVGRWHQEATLFFSFEVIRLTLTTVL